MASLVVRLLAGLVFLGAGLLKVRDTQEFAIAIHNYRLTSSTLSILIAVYLPWLEIVTGFCLMTRRLYAGALAASIGMAVLFLGAISSAWWRGLDVACGCFGPEINPTSYPLHLAGDLLLLGLLVFLSFAERRAARKTSA